jgi:hypothetical protein
MIPDALRPDYEPCLLPGDRDREHGALVTAADKLCAYLKCLEEMSAGNPEFAQAERALRRSVEDLGLPEVQVTRPGAPVVFWRLRMPPRVTRPVTQREETVCLA